MNASDPDSEREIATVESATAALLNRSEIDMQITTAKKYPRSIKRFREEAYAMVTLNEAVAGECIYALPRREKDKESGQWITKNIEGPSARFAEIIVSAWGNARAGARVVSDEGQFVTAQGVMHDLEKNVAITYEVQRRIVDSQNRRYKPDMIGVTANAASSIALRNAILKVVPKAFWVDLYQAARSTVMGDIKTLANRRSDAVKEFQKFGVQPAAIYTKLGVAGMEDITLEHLLTLRGLLTAIRDGDTTAEQAFAADPMDTTAGAAAATWTAEAFATQVPKWAAAVTNGKSPADILAMARSKHALTPEQEAQITALKPQPAADGGAK